MLLFSTVKILLSVAAALLIAEISKRVSPALGGVLPGLAPGMGIAVYFLGPEQGVPFVLSGIPRAIAGLASSLAFAAADLCAGLKCARVVAGPLAASLAAFTAFFLCAAVVRALSCTLPASILFFV